tara:strand:+ start:1215 stop:1961 length:747 start_codon:yes stop_codon:yes gene_type:complete
MAISAAITLTSAAGDLTSDALSLSTSTSLSKAGLSTAIASTTGLARKTTSYASSGVIDTSVLYRADDYTNDGANKMYLKNMSTTVTEYFTVYMTGDRGGETHTYTDGLIELGRLYAGDWMFMPWNATGGTKEAFTVTFANTWAAGDTFVFDGATVISAGSGLNEMASAVDAVQYPNWTTSVSSAVVTFTARTSRADLEIDTSEAISTTAGDGTGAVATTVAGKKSVSDIYIKPSVHTDMVLEHMLFYQ